MRSILHRTTGSFWEFHKHSSEKLFIFFRGHVKLAGSSWFMFISFQSLASVTHGHGKHHAGHRPELGKGLTQDEAEQPALRPALWGTRHMPCCKLSCGWVSMYPKCDVRIPTAAPLAIEAPQPVLELCYCRPPRWPATSACNALETPWSNSSPLEVQGTPGRGSSSAVPVFQVSVINFTATPVSSLTLVPRGTAGVFVGESVTGNPISPTQTNKSCMLLIGGWTIQFEN